MSTHFSANQYNSAFRPCHLQNHEVPRKFKEFPSQRKGYTTIIANDRGHLLHDSYRGPISPWGHFMGTWQKPKKPIKLRIKTKLMTRGYDASVWVNNGSVSNSIKNSPKTEMDITNADEEAFSQGNHDNISADAQSPPRSGAPHSTTNRTSTPPMGSLPASRSASAQSNRSICSNGSGSFNNKSAGHTPFTRDSKSSGNRGNSPVLGVGSLRSGQSTPIRASSSSEKKPPMSYSSSRISSAPVISRSMSNSSRQSIQSSQSVRSNSVRPGEIAADIAIVGHEFLPPTQGSCSSRPESRQNQELDHSVIMAATFDEGRLVTPSSYIDDSRPPSNGKGSGKPSTATSIAHTSSTMSGGLKSRGVQHT